MVILIITDFGGSFYIFYIELTLSKYEIPDRSFSLCAGGLVGYAGHGLKAYDVKVETQNNNTKINIGKIPDNQSNATAIAGGIVGLMQPADDKVDTCTATFINCEVKNINIAGEYAGGLYGGTWGEVSKHNSTWVPYSINLENCKITGLNPDNKNTITATKLAGGAVAYAKVSKAGNPNFLISNTTISNYKIDANDSQYAGGFMGYAEVNDSASAIVCYIHDSSVENCQIGTGTTYLGGAIGVICPNTGTQPNQILGYNIKLNNVTSSSTNMGAWIGFVNNNDNTTSIQFTGLGIYGNGFAKNVGNRSDFTNASFIFSDYTGECNSETPNANPDVSNLNKGTTVDMPKYPFVNIFPQSALGTDEILSGDGAVFGKEEVSSYKDYPSKNTMVAKIYSEKNNTGTGKQYYNTFVDDSVNNGNTIDTYLKRTTEDDGDRISTFATEQGITLPNGVDDFAVLVIATSNDTETTNLINRYIQLVTNTPNSGATANFADTSAGYHKLEVKTCKLNAESGSFTIIEDNSPGLKYDADNKKFGLDVENADSLYTNTFTLLDVQFLDPFGKKILPIIFMCRFTQFVKCRLISMQLRKRVHIRQNVLRTVMRI